MANIQMHSDTAVTTSISILKVCTSFCTVINHYLPENLIACRKTYRAYLPDFFGNTVPLVPVDVPVRMSALLSH